MTSIWLICTIILMWMIKAITPGAFLLYPLFSIFVVDVHFSKTKSLSLIVPSSDACLLLLLWTNCCRCYIGSNYSFICPWSFLAAHLVLDCIPHLIVKQLFWHSFFIFHLLHLLKCKNWLHCQYFNSVLKYHYWSWYWCCLIMDGNESCPQAENAFKNESKSLAIKAPWEAIILQDGCVVWSWRLVVL